MGFARCICNTKAKLAINRKINKNLRQSGFVYLLSIGNKLSIGTMKTAAK